MALLPDLALELLTLLLCLVLLDQLAPRFLLLLLCRQRFTLRLCHEFGPALRILLCLLRCEQALD
jgi:hypothetical protein